jgi:predicted permease
MALATVLVIGSGLLLSSVRALRAVDPGLDARDVVAVELGAPSEYSGARAVAFYDQLMARLTALPGVRAAGAIHLTPVTRGNWSFPYLAEGIEPPDGPLPDANFRVVTPTYFEAVDQPLLRGRALTADDRSPEAAPVGLINRALAERIWPSADPIGRVIKIFGNQPFTVVGVVGDVRQTALDAEPQPELYLPHGRSWGLSAMTVMVETDGDPAQLGAAAVAEAHALDPAVPVIRSRPLSQVLDESMAQRRFFAGVLTFFGALALGLGALGVYGVVGTMMSARRAEYGVRMALGASRGRVLWSALAGALGPIAVGLAAGMAGAAWGSRLLGALLFEVGPRDPGTFAASGLVLALAAVLAVTLPALRATRVDAARVLRAE